MARIFLNFARRAQENSTAPIPVLVELKSYRLRDGIWGLVQTSLEEYDLYLEVPEIKKLVAEKQLVLLIDGLNELPEKSARTELESLCRRSIQLIATTRDLGKNLAIDRKLEIQPLNPREVKTFLLERLSNHDRARVKELCDRVQDFGQTPLMVWMLYSVFSQKDEIPETRGEAYRAFTTLYVERAKEGIDLDESRFLLSKLAFEMMQSPTPIEFRLEITEVEAENLLTLQKVCKHLLSNHLLQWEGKPGNRQIRFCHQSLQEYYAAEALLMMFQEQHPDVIEDERFQHFYLNYLKWTESIAILLGLPEITETQAERIIKLALDTSLMFGARLAGEVKTKFQERTTSLVSKLDLSEQLKVEALGQTKSEFVLQALINALDHSDYDVCLAAVNALIYARSRSAACALKDRLSKLKEKTQQQKEINNRDIGIYSAIIQALSYLDPQEALKEIRSEEEDPLLKVSYWFEQFHILVGQLSGVKCLPEVYQYAVSSNSSIRQQAAETLGEIDTEDSIQILESMLEDPEFEVRRAVVLSLAKLRRADLATQQLVNDISDKKASEWATKTLIEFNPKNARALLLNLLKSPVQQCSLNAAWILSHLGYEDAIPLLREKLKNESYVVRRTAAISLGQLKREEAIPELKQALRHYLFAPDREIRIAHCKNNQDEIFILGADDDDLFSLGDTKLHWRWSWEIRSSKRQVADALIKIETQEAINVLVDALATWHPSQIEAAVALTQHERYEGISVLLNHVKIPNAIFIKESIRALTTAAFKGCLEILPELFELAETDKYTILREFALTSGNLFDDPSLLSGFNILERLKNLLLRCPDDYLNYAIAAIQNRCQFYNYEILQNKPELIIQPSDRSPKYIKIEAEVAQIIENNHGTVIAKRDSKAE